MFILLIFFFFKPQTAYNVRISDWSSDVCSSDLLAFHQVAPDQCRLLVPRQGLEHLLLPGMIIADREGHELVQRKSILAIDLNEFRADRAKPEPPLHHLGRHAETRANL